MSKKEEKKQKTKTTKTKEAPVKEDLFGHLSNSDREIVERYENELNTGSSQFGGKTTPLRIGQLGYREKIVRAVVAGKSLESAKEEISKSFFETPQQQRNRYWKELESGIDSRTGETLTDTQKGIRLGLFNRDRKTGEAYNYTARKFNNSSTEVRREHLRGVGNALVTAGAKSQAKIDEFKANSGQLPNSQKKTAS
ncbi:MAG: hypothetical protein FWC11_00300 [Firmicutes bacterium]|nr:hypothetical protein [Bacillota bacterium]